MLYIISRAKFDICWSEHQILEFQYISKYCPISSLYNVHVLNYVPVFVEAGAYCLSDVWRQSLF